MNSGEKTARTTIFHQLLRPDAAEDYVVPTVEELKDEAYILLAAAADTTGNALTIAAYNVAINPEISSRLTAELKETFPGPEPSMDFITLEKLPYLVSLCSRVRAMSILVNMLLDCGYQGSSTVNIPLSFVYIKKKKNDCSLFSLSCGVPGRLPRVVPESGAEFNGYYVPFGVRLSDHPGQMFRR